MRLLTVAIASLLLTAQPALLPAQPASGVDTSASDAAIETALGALNRGEAQQAVATLEALRDSGNANTDALSLLAAIYFDLGRHLDALTLARFLTQRADAGAADLYTAARAAVQLGEDDEAEGLFERVLALDPGHPAGRELGLLRGRNGETESALELLGTWSEANPDDIEARLAAALAALRIDRTERVARLLADLPQSLPPARLLWARLLLAQDQPHGAFDMLRPLLAAPGGAHPTVRRTAAEALIDLARPEQALSLLGSNLEPGSEAAATAARAFHQLGRHGAALEALEPLLEALEAEPSLLPTRRTAETARLGADLHSALGNAERARALERLAESLTASPATEASDADAVGQALEQAADLAQKQRFEEALDRVLSLAADAPDDPRPRVAAARLLVATRRPERALLELDRAVRLDRQNPAPLHQRAQLLQAEGRLDEAQRDLLRVIELEPRHPTARHELARLFVTRGDTEAAKRVLREQLEVEPGDPRAAALLRQLGDS